MNIQLNPPLLAPDKTPVAFIVDDDQETRHLLKHLNALREHDSHPISFPGDESAIQLQRSLQFETILKQMSDRVCGSLDEHQILQTIVKDLAIALDLHRCHTGIYNLEQRTCTLQYKYAEGIAAYQDRVLQLDDHPEIYHTLLQGNAVHFSPIQPHPDLGQVAMFVFPLKNEQTIGDLWLIAPADRVLDDLEIRLVKQVANQGAIALRQAKLYQKSQAQVKEIVQIKQLKDDFLSTISHELRTPITSMKLAIQLLEHSLQAATELAKNTPALTANLMKSNSYLKILHNECEKEISLIDDLLNLQQLEAGEHTPNLILLHLYEWLFEEIDAFTLRAESRRQAFQINLFPHPVMLQIDPIHLRRILTELVNNACKYSPPEAVITLSIGSEGKQEPNGNQVTPSPQNLAVISVTNTGVEIPPSALEKVFEKFYRIPESDRWNQGGTGLGLALVKRLVELYGGSIQVTSGDNQTCFTVTLQMTHQQCEL